MLLHIGHYAQNAAGSPFLLVGFMLGGAGVGLAIAFGREIRAFVRKRRVPLDHGDDSA